jgi:hypothetical protein
MFTGSNIGAMAAWVPTDFAEEFVPHIEHSEVARELGENARRLAMTDYTWVAAIVLGKPLVSAMGRQLLEDCAEIHFASCRKLSEH